MSENLPYVTGSETSQAAAEKAADGAAVDRAKILQLLRTRGPLTCDEIELVVGLSHQTASARCTGLKNKYKLIRETGEKRDTRTGTPAAILEAIPADELEGDSGGEASKPMTTAPKALWIRDPTSLADATAAAAAFADFIAEKPRKQRKQAELIHPGILRFLREYAEDNMPVVAPGFPLAPNGTFTDPYGNCEPPAEGSLGPPTVTLPGDTGLAARFVQMQRTLEWISQYTVRYRRKLSSDELDNVGKRVGAWRKQTEQLAGDLSAYVGRHAGGAP